MTNHNSLVRLRCGIHNGGFGGLQKTQKRNMNNGAHNAILKMKPSTYFPSGLIIVGVLHVHSY